MERNRPSVGHSRPGDSRERDLSGHRSKPTKQGALTSWRQQREGLVRTQKETDRARCTHCLETAERGTYQGTKETNRAWGTHSLETAEGGTCQDTERIRLSVGHSLSGDGRERDLSGHGKKYTKRGILTLWRAQRKGQVRTRKECARATRA